MNLYPIIHDAVVDYLTAPAFEARSKDKFAAFVWAAGKKEYSHFQFEATSQEVGAMCGGNSTEYQASVAATRRNSKDMTIDEMYHEDFLNYDKKEGSSWELELRLIKTVALRLQDAKKFLEHFFPSLNPTITFNYSEALVRHYESIDDLLDFTRDIKPFKFKKLM